MAGAGGAAGRPGRRARLVLRVTSSSGLHPGPAGAEPGPGPGAGLQALLFASPPDLTTRGIARTAGLVTHVESQLDLPTTTIRVADWRKLTGWASTRLRGGRDTPRRISAGRWKR